MSVKKDLTGSKFGSLVVAEFAYSKNKQSYWKCKCDCGNETVVACSKLTSGHTKSCGCRRSTQAAAIHTKHGHRNDRVYQCWRGMNQRCGNPRNPAYPKYGGRGISVCDEWQHSFESFYKWAMSNGYNDGLTLERNDVNLGYNPENCCWATQKTQQNNRRNNHLVSFNGETKTVAQWADAIGISYGTLLQRLRNGWSAEAAIQTPLRTSRNGKHVYVDLAMGSVK